MPVRRQAGDWRAAAGYAEAMCASAPDGGSARVLSGRPARMRQRLGVMAARLAAGGIETPQRMHGVAAWAMGDATAAMRLLRLLLAMTLEAAVEDGAPPATLDLLVPLVAAVDDPAAPDVAAILALAPRIAAAQPVRFRRRSIHCHGRIAPDRALLVADAVCRVCLEWPSFFHWAWAIAYAITEYDHDHLVMRGPRVEARVRRLAAWIGAQDDTGAADPGEALPWVALLRADQARRRAEEQARDRAVAAARRAAEHAANPDMRVPRAPPPTDRPPTAPERLAGSLRTLAMQLAAGASLPPECLLPVAHWAVANPHDRRRLVRHLINTMAHPLYPWPGRGVDDWTLLRQLDDALDEVRPDAVPDRDGINVMAATAEARSPAGDPGPGASGRSRWLFTRAVLDELRSWPFDPIDAHPLQLMLDLAYAWRDADRRMLDARSTKRLTHLCHWLHAAEARAAPDDGTDLQPAAK